jgi:hypothetical protein
MLDESAVLACSVYVDLNPIRGEIAETPETSWWTGRAGKRGNDHELIRAFDIVPNTFEVLATGGRGEELHVHVDVLARKTFR